MKKSLGIIQGGPYEGQKYAYAGECPSPRWASVWLEEKRFGYKARRDVPAKYLEDIETVSF
jgi:hypothetical protein